MLFAVLLGVASASQCDGLDSAACILQSGCWYDDTKGCSTECVDMGIPAAFQAWFPNCDSICGAPTLMLAAQMFCTNSCGMCPTPEPTAEPTEGPTEEPDVFVKSNAACSRQELQNEIELAIYDQINAGSFDAVGPCLTMRSHLAYILNMKDELVGTPDGLLICGCFQHLQDDEWAQEHLNCELAGHHIYDLSKQCADIGGYKDNACDLDAIEATMASKSACSGFRSAISTYGSFAFNPMAVCDCFDQFSDIEAAETFNCRQGGEHLMELYTDVCPAYVDPCNRDDITNALTEYVIENRLVDSLAEPCTAMGNHFNTVLDSNDMLMAGKYADFALICQCLGGLDRDFVDNHLRCGVGGHDAYSIWSQCSEHTPRCEDMGCELCDSKIRCSMSTDGTCKTSCPNDGTCFDDPAVSTTCADL